MTIDRRTSTAEIRNLEPRRSYVPGYKARRREREQHDWNVRMLHRYERDYTSFLSHGSAQAQKRPPPSGSQLRLLRPQRSGVLLMWNAARQICFFLQLADLDA